MPLGAAVSRQNGALRNITIFSDVPQPIPTAAAVREEEPGPGGSGRPPAADGFILG